MKLVAIDGFDLRIRGKGVSRSLQNIIPRLLRSQGQLRYVVLTTAEGRRTMGEDVKDFCIIVPKMPGSVWEQFGLPRFARRAGADLIYSQRECGPLWGLPYVLHIHEDPALRWAVDRARGSRERLRRAYTRLAFPRSLRRAPVILASTQATATMLLRRTALDPHRVRVVHLGVDDCFFEVEPPLDSASYILHLGSSDVRDNTSLVIRSYFEVRRTKEALPPLIVAGDMGDTENEIREDVKQLDLSKHVRLLGRVSDSELASLFAGADVTVLPSSAEGFGLQPLEALASGSAVIALDTDASRETLNGHAKLVSSTRAEEVAGAIEAVLATKEDPIDRLARREHARRFRWERTSEMLEEVFEQVFQ
jgi:glycosyltransferase involved in cell wall biosynthesis